MIYLYAITDRPEAFLPIEQGLACAPPLSLSGPKIAGRGGCHAADSRAWQPAPLPNLDLLSLAYRDIAAVVSHLSRAEVLPTPENLWQHEEVVEALMANHTVLPMRFGTVLADERAVRAVLAAHYADFGVNLERVRGRVEVGLRVIGAEADSQPPPDVYRKRLGDAPPAMSGRSYLMARLEQERQTQAGRQEAEALALELDTQLAGLAVESTHQVLVTPHLFLTAAYLLARDRMLPFRREVEKLRAAYPKLRFLCTGPWPAYSFVTATGSNEF